MNEHLEQETFRMWLVTLTAKGATCLMGHFHRSISFRQSQQHIAAPRYVKHVVCFGGRVQLLKLSNVRMIYHQGASIVTSEALHDAELLKLLQALERSHVNVPGKCIMIHLTLREWP